ncbi:MAG: AMP-binding protein [Solobacterium sp.]|nr:AMP-binding protein [Solobacterium sp.]
MALTLIQRINELAEEIPSQIALAFKNETLNYKELNERISSVASRMKELGIQKGDRVLFSAVSKPESVVIYLAVQYIGAIAVFIDKNAVPATAAKICEDAGGVIFFTDKPMKEYESACRIYSLRKVYSETGREPAVYEVPDDDEIAELIYTSGTTGRPKGCMLSYKAVRTILLNTIEGVGMREDDVVLLPLPLNHSFALRVLRAALYLGAAVVLQNGFTFAKEIENNLDKYHCTGIAIVSASVETITKQMQDRFEEIMGRFRYLEASAGSLSVDQRKRLTRQLPNTVIHNTWGSSESGGALFLNVTEIQKNEPEKIGALGRPIHGVEVITVDETGKPFQSDRAHPGRMAIRGDMQMKGYWNQPELSAETLKDGWLLTGDIVYEEDGYFYMLGRADDIINVGGDKVSPVEVENIASEYPGIAECAVIGVPDPEGILGSVPVMYVVGRYGYSEEMFRKFLASKLDKYKVPVQFVEMLALPRNGIKKVDRKALKKQWEQHGNETIHNEVLHTIMTRRSVRNFTDQPIDRESAEVIVMAGYHAPSGHNMQTWRFTVIRSPEALQRLKAAAETAAREKGVYFYGWENPAMIILVSNDSRNVYGCQDSSAASENMMLAAWSLGIGSVWLNPLNTLRNVSPVKEVLDEFGIPENHIIWSSLAMGYPLADGVKLEKNTKVVQWIE